MPPRYVGAPQHRSYPPLNALAGRGVSAVCRQYHRRWLLYKLLQPGCGAGEKLLTDFRMSHQLMMVDYSSYVAAAPVSPDYRVIYPRESTRGRSAFIRVMPERGMPMMGKNLKVT